MISTKLSAALLAVCAASATFAQQPPTLLTLSATSEVQAVPDLASIGAGVVTQAVDAQTALATNSQMMVRVVAALRKAGIAERDIQTSGLNLQPQFRYEQNQPPVLTGFQASNRVQIRLRDVAATGRVVDALVQQGANQIDGPDFRVAHPEPLLDRARAEAVAMARTRAELYAKAAGLAVRRITAINEGSEPRQPMPRLRVMSMEAASDAPPVVPGEVALSASVTMEFELGPL